VKRLTDEDLAELERLCESRELRRAGDSLAFDTDVIFGGLASLLVEVRELRRQNLEYQKVLSCFSGERGWTCGKCNSCEDYARIIAESEL
jgi:7-cyano-7-deazaguanine synthase in queuosine biosynthesis